MKWEELPYGEIEKLAAEGYVVILPVGSMEVHGPHLPLGTDALLAYKASVEAARREKAIVLPPLFYAYVPENRHFPGTISLHGETLLKLLEEICDEVARSGFNKILIVNGHGGNSHLLRLFLREMLFRNKPYKVYAIIDAWGLFREEIEKVKETKIIGHAGEIETSLVMYAYPDLCRMEKVKGEAKLGTKQLQLLPGLETPVDWICYAVEGYVGDPRAASAEKGKRLFESWVKALVEVIRMVREDKSYDEVMRRYAEEIKRAIEMLKL
ncbi:MAG: creatininase family protein [Thermoprotei archaeon]|nr:MAG: creatininase family protein [Thermoprotei archaeon]RLF24819.1 MAG: creatininase family protein [Thermoprotei archaeon]